MENETVQNFAVQLFRLNAAMAQLFESGNTALFTEMNAAVKEMYRLQHGSEDPIMRALEQECSVVYQNFDMIIAVLRTTEEGVIDEGAQTALNKFLHNIDEAVVNMASALGLVDRA